MAKKKELTAQISQLVSTSTGKEIDRIFVVAHYVDGSKETFNGPDEDPKERSLRRRAERQAQREAASENLARNEAEQTS